MEISGLQMIFLVKWIFSVKLILKYLAETNTELGKPERLSKYKIYVHMLLSSHRLSLFRTTRKMYRQVKLLNMTKFIDDIFRNYILNTIFQYKYTGEKFIFLKFFYQRNFCVSIFLHVIEQKFHYCAKL